MVNLGEEFHNIHYYEDVLSDYRDRIKPLDLNLTLENVIDMLLEGYTWNPPRLSQVPKPNGKMRDIYIFQPLDSFYQKVINKILFVKCKHLIHSNVFSYLKGVCTHNAAVHIQSKLKEKCLFGVKIDISNYFLSVDKNCIFKAIDEIVEDKLGRELLYRLFSIDSYEYKNELHNKYLSLMPGSAISSYFANYMLRSVDNYLQKSTEIFARYSDDIIFFCNTKEEIEIVLSELKVMLAELGLSFNSDKLYYFDEDEIIDFLGLNITQDYIDINKATLSSTKKHIKKVCNNVRRSCEKHKCNRDFSYVRKAIKTLNRTMYKTFLHSDNDHKGGRARYIFSNVTIIDSLQKIDYYIKDRLRYVYSGKNNSGSVHILNDSVLKELGYVSIVSLYYLYRMDKDVYKNEVYLMDKDKCFSSVYAPVIVDKLANLNFKTYRLKNSFSDLYFNLLKNNGYFYFNGLRVYPEYITFDLDNHIIRFGDVIIAKGNHLVIKDIYCNIKGRYLHYVFDTNKVSSLRDKDSSTLMRLFLSSSYKTNLVYESNKLLLNYPMVEYFRTYSLFELLNYYSEVYLDIDNSYNCRRARFMAYLFFHLVSNELWEGIDYSKKFIKIKDNKFSLILKRSWINLN